MLRYFVFILSLMLSIDCHSQNNLLKSYIVDSMRSFTTDHVETSKSYVFGANFYNTPFDPVNLINSAKLVAIDKQTLQHIVETFPIVGDTSYRISSLAAINDTLHCIIMKSWTESSTMANHHRIYSARYNDQLQLIQSTLIKSVDDTAGNTFLGPGIKFGKDVYLMFYNYAVPNNLVAKYSIFSIHTDSLLVDEVRLNQDHGGHPSWYENVGFASFDDSSNIFISAVFLGASFNTYENSVLVKLNRHNGYSTPEKIHYFWYDSTSSYETLIRQEPYVEKRGARYFFLAKAGRLYFAPTSVHTNIGIFKGHFQDSCIKMDTSYITTTSYPPHELHLA